MRHTSSVSTIVTNQLFLLFSDPLLLLAWLIRNNFYFWFIRPLFWTIFVFECSIFLLPFHFCNNLNCLTNMAVGRNSKWVNGVYKQNLNVMTTTRSFCVLFIYDLIYRIYLCVCARVLVLRIFIPLLLEQWWISI